MSAKTARITRKKPVNAPSIAPKPNLPKRLFWEFRYDEMDWVSDYGTVIERVMEWGNEEEWLEVIRYLVGGTDLALQMGHRILVDIDLFSKKPFNSKNLATHLVTKYPDMNAVTAQITLGYHEEVKLSSKVEHLRKNLTWPWKRRRGH